jgi:hypothetical protein
VDDVTGSIVCVILKEGSCPAHAAPVDHALKVQMVVVNYRYCDEA